MKFKYALGLLAVCMLFTAVFAGCGNSSANTAEKPTEKTTTVAPTTEASTTLAPTTQAPTTEAPTTEPETEAPTTEPPTQAEKNYSSYMNMWGKDYGHDATCTLKFLSIDDNEVCFTLSQTSPNVTHIALTESIYAEIDSNDEIYFDFTDSFGNIGTGVVQLSGDSIHVKTTITEYSTPYIFGLSMDCDMEYMGYQNSAQG